MNYLVEKPEIINSNLSKYRKTYLYVRKLPKYDEWKYLFINEEY